MNFSKENISSVLKNNPYDLKEFDSKAICPKSCIQGFLKSSLFKDAHGKVLTDKQELVTRLKILGETSPDCGLNFSLAAHFLAGVLPLNSYLKDEQKASIFTSLEQNNYLIGNGMTEDQSGSDAFNMKTLAQKTPDGYIITGEKSFVSNLNEAEHVIVYALTNKDKGAIGGVSAFLLGVDDFTITSLHDKMGLRTCSSGTIKIDSVFISSKKMIGQEGSGLSVFQEAMTWERIGIGALHVGTMKRLLNDVIAFSKTRKSANKPIKAFQSVAHKLVDLKLALTTCEALLDKTINQMNDKQLLAMNSSMCKLHISETLVEFCTTLMSIYGAQAYQKGHELERILRDAHASVLYSGTSNIQKNIIARWMGL